jgi:hypothetical protein
MGVPGGRVALAVVALTATALLACVREPLDDTCPDVAEGDLVITEIRGPQSANSQTIYRQWIEVYNASDAPIAAKGLFFDFTKFDGKNFFTVFVRDESLVIEPGDYFVVGGGDPGEHPYIDYDYTPDHHSTTAGKEKDPADLYAGGTLQLSVCGIHLDRTVFQLPGLGTLSLDGNTTPDARTNDDYLEGWCVDESPIEGSETLIGRGPPGEANLPCP